MTLREHEIPFDDGGLRMTHPAQTWIKCIWKPVGGSYPYGIIHQETWVGLAPAMSSVIFIRLCFHVIV
jgi:hypothetical protein